MTARATLHISCFGVNLAGQDVRISDESGALVAVSTIDERTGEGPWTVEFEVPPAPFYTVEVGTNDTEDQAFTEAEMAEGDLLLVANPADC